MILDTSALVAIILQERGFEGLWAKIVAAPGVGVGAPSLVEAGMVIRGRLGKGGRTLLDAGRAELQIRTESFDERHWPVALDAFTRFGRGRHPAGLNFADCLAYATASVAREPLLCLGDDFAQTDLELA